MHQGEPTLVFRACSETCEMVQYLLEQADELDKDVRVKPIAEFTITCLTCGKVMDGFTGLDGAVLPEPDDLSVCIYCANVAVFDRNPDGDMYLRLPTGDERAAIGCNEMVTKAVRLIKEQIA